MLSLIQPPVIDPSFEPRRSGRWESDGEPPTGRPNNTHRMKHLQRRDLAAWIRLVPKQNSTAARSVSAASREREQLPSTDAGCWRHGGHLPCRAAWHQTSVAAAVASQAATKVAAVVCA